MLDIEAVTNGYISVTPIRFDFSFKALKQGFRRYIQVRSRITYITLCSFYKRICIQIVYTIRKKQRKRIVYLLFLLFC